MAAPETERNDGITPTVEAASDANIAGQFWLALRGASLLLCASGMPFTLKLKILLQ